MVTKFRTMLEDLIFMAEQTDNLYFQRQLEKIKKVLEENSNDMLLGQELRKLLK